MALLAFELAGEQTVRHHSGWRINATSNLWLDPWIRYALALQFIAAIAGAQMLVNTVGYVQSTLQLGKTEYGWAMAAFSIDWFRTFQE
ncbi:hypothetical protein [Acaryochloris sp. CCMEE 5410]|uniref:hypothetical protein n=1 Tax=Acaryochloris sp. CCMEE 5410 TaxID=310037 RepID=UPI001F16322B|nr:hypothetical protein [Acaryochloris sp. CCMEE 5410]